MVEPFIGEISMVGFNFPPRGFAFCDGQLLPIAQNTALFSLLGTTYGGDGRTTFALPDLRGRFPLHAGRGPGLVERSIGEKNELETDTVQVKSPILGCRTITFNSRTHMPPYLAIRFVIALVGIFPSRS